MLHSPVLVLNATYEPVNVCAARRAIILILNVHEIQRPRAFDLPIGDFATCIRGSRLKRATAQAQTTQVGVS